MGNCCSYCKSCFDRRFPSDTYLPKPPTDAEPDGDTSLILKAERVEFCVKENAKNHYTDNYHQINQIPPKLIIRRGFTFKIKIRFDRKLDKASDALCLVFTVKDAKMPSYAQGTMIIIPVEEEDNSVLPAEGWKAKFLSESEDEWINIEVKSDAKAIIGEWLVEVDTKCKNGNRGHSLRHSVKDPIYLLFNPWCEEDQVYMEKEEWKKEYVLNDTGLIWRGTHNSLRPTGWTYAQFEENILEVCCYLLNHVGKLNIVSRADPVKVSRHVSAVVNSPDESGVVEGKWFGNYKGGQNPTSWTGSQAILQKYNKSKRPVKYGQCWVFAGVCATVCRCLGIPCRTVTNYSSAHDTHNSLTIDYFYDNEGNPVKQLNKDSVWTFHVWNEGWMKRPDLSANYDGWQVIDATPQEVSDGQYRCGPASVFAVKRGEVLKTFDTTFVFSEVNADKVFWRYHGRNQPLKLIYTSTEEIGQFISTKAIGGFERSDITNEYKFKERSSEEREVMLKALRLKKDLFSRYYLNDEFEDVEFTFKLLDDIVIGSSFSVRLKAKNKSGENKEHTIKAVLRVDTVHYTGEIKKQVKKEEYKFTIKPGQENEIVLKVTYPEYEELLADQANFNIAALATVMDTNFDYFAQDDFRVRMPDITIETDDDLIAGEEFTAHAFFRNPLPKQLKKGVFLFEGPGLTQPMTVKLKEPVSAGGEARVKVTMIPRTPGEKTIVAKFSSKELDDVDGFKTITVKSKAGINEENSHV